jgi:hypothetical protein
MLRIWAAYALADTGTPAAILGTLVQDADVANYAISPRVEAAIRRRKKSSANAPSARCQDDSPL